ncbi:MAG: caspase family protein [Xenococcaceae cyanobacterium MO_188.B29]|nr:caspase family protein [Xenococcaceae cyanobacterium MO_188.B29]
MSRIKRRHFLQLAGSTLATLGWSQGNLWNTSNNYGKVLAQSTSRKLALLIGINQYDRNSSGWIPLRGCVTDIQLQRELLINCFGFQSQDILTLSDRAATRQNILTAFEEHLIKQAKPGDVVVFHFSGHGSRVQDKDSQDGFNGTIVPIDSPNNDHSQVKDIMGQTLFLLTSALKTENVTMVLDCCYSGGTTRGNLRVRSRSSDGNSQIVAAEKEYQQQWLSKLNFSPQEFRQRRQQGIAKGVAITSAQKNQLAVDVSFDGFAAGAFTYAMTQYLWQQIKNPPLDITIANTEQAIELIAPSSLQEPSYEVSPDADYPPESVYFLDKQTPPAEAVITEVDSNSVQVWLGGIDAQSVVAFNRGSTLSVIDPQQNQLATVELDAREGLIGYGKLVTEKPDLSRGSLLQEKIRSIPAELKLKIGLDDSAINYLREIQQVLAPINRVEVLPLQQGEVDYIFGRFTSEMAEFTTATPPPLNSWGLFYPDLTFLTGSFHTSDENIISAIERLHNKFQSLLAIKLIRLTLNPHSSHLKVSATLSNRHNPQQTLGEAVTTRSNFQYRSASLSGIERIPLGISLQFSIVNQEEFPIYVTIIAIDSEGTIVVVFPNHWTNLAQQISIPPQTTRKIPDNDNSEFELYSSEPLGMTEVLIISSTKPLKSSLLKLEQLARQAQVSRGAMTLSQPTEIIEDMILDFDSRTRNPEISTQKKSNYLIDTTQLAILSIPLMIY